MANRHRLVALLAVLSLATAACSSGATPRPPRRRRPHRHPPRRRHPPPHLRPRPRRPRQRPSRTTREPRRSTRAASSTAPRPRGTRSIRTRRWVPSGSSTRPSSCTTRWRTQFTPWLAESGTWTDANTYTIKIRQGVQWSDGQPFTADDVAFTIGLCDVDQGPGLQPLPTSAPTATATDPSTVVVKFTNPAYQEWSTWTYNSPIVPKHIWSSLANEDILKTTNENGVGTGPYMYKTHADDRMVWVKNDNWWGIAAGHPVAPNYIVDIVNGANSTALGHGAPGRPRPEQQLPARRRRARQPRLCPDLLPGGAVHAVGQHGLARPEHQEGAPQRSAVPHRDRGRDQRQRRDQQGLRRHRCRSQPDGPASFMGQVRRQERRRAARPQVRSGQGEGDPGRGRLQGRQ